MRHDGEEVLDELEVRLVVAEVDLYPVNAVSEKRNL